MLDVEKGKGGSGDKEQVYVVKTTGCQKILAFIFLLVLGGGLFFLFQENQLRTKEFITELTKKQLAYIQQATEVNTHEEKNLHRDTLLELQSHLQQEVAEQAEDAKLSQAAIAAIQKGREQDKRVISKFMEDLEKNLHTSVDAKIKKAMEDMDDKKLDPTKLQKSLEGIKKSISSKFEKSKKHLDQDIGSYHDEVVQIAKSFADDASVHGNEAAGKLAGLNDQIKQKDVELMESNQHMFNFITGGKARPEDIKKMLSNLQVYLPTIMMRNTRELDLLKNNVVPDEYANAFFDEETIQILTELQDAIRQKEIQEDEVSDLLADLAKEGSIPPPTATQSTLREFVDDLIAASQQPPRARVGDYLSLEVGRFTKLTGNLQYSLEISQGDAIKIDPNTGKIFGVPTQDGNFPFTVTATAPDGTTDKFSSPLVVLKKDEDYATRSIETQNRLTKQLEKLVKIQESLASWTANKINDNKMWGMVRQAVIDRDIKAADVMSQQAPSEAAARPKEMTQDTVEWLRNGLEQMRTNSIDKNSFFKEVVNKYNEGMIPKDIYVKLQADMAQAMSVNNKPREHHEVPRREKGKRPGAIPKASPEDVAKARKENRRRAHAAAAKAKQAAMKRSQENKRERDMARKEAMKMKNKDLSEDQKANIAQERHREQVAHQPEKAQQASVTANKYQVRPLVAHEGHTVGGPWTANLEQCQQQCDITPTCKSFSYSKARQECALKDMCVQAYSATKDAAKIGDWKTYYKPCSESPAEKAARQAQVHWSQVEANDKKAAEEAKKHQAAWDKQNGGNGQATAQAGQAGQAGQVGAAPRNDYERQAALQQQRWRQNPWISKQQQQQQQQQAAMMGRPVQGQGQGQQGQQGQQQGQQGQQQGQPQQPWQRPASPNGQRRAMPSGMMQGPGGMQGGPGGMQGGPGGMQGAPPGGMQGGFGQPGYGGQQGYGGQGQAGTQ